MSGGVSLFHAVVCMHERGTSKEATDCTKQLVSRTRCRGALTAGNAIRRSK